PRRALAMPGASPPDRVTDWNRRRIGIDEVCADFPRALELGVLVLAPRRHGLSPMQMKLVLRDSVTVAPNATAANDHGRRTENGLELCPRGFRIFVAFNGDSEALSDILLGRGPVVVEGRYGRTEHHGLGILGRTPGIVLGRVAEEFQVVFDNPDRGSAKDVVGAFDEGP